ncbi:MAG: sialate O-acetylesterase [Opitutaceae bacterium]|jgi:sialate O-acetylesterase
MAASSYRFAAVLGIAVLGGSVRGTVSLPAVLGDHAVLQRDAEIPVWGWAGPGEPVAVSFAGQTRSTRADAAGRWRVTLAPLAASAQPRDLLVQGINTVRSRDVLVGEVWLCSGQSNMEKPLGERAGQKPVFNFEAELAAAHFPEIRLMKVPKLKADSPAPDAQTGWVPCEPASLDQTKFSAAGYFFGRKLFQELQVPIGLIDSTFGGTLIEPWTPGSPAGNLYNGMIHPLVPFRLRGVLWYQGETNLMDLNDGANYSGKMERLIDGWRAAWRQPDLPFYYAELAPFAYHLFMPERVASPELLPRFWEAQAACRRIPHTGMIVTTDLVDDLFDIHPRNKQEVGRRFALLALARTYGRNDVVCEGPEYRRLELRGDRAILHFDGVDGGLMSRDGKALTWFTVAAAGGEFQPAAAEIDGDTVVVHSPRVARPAIVRFAWDEGARPNLCNRAGLPALPFRTDSPPPALDR